MTWHTGGTAGPDGLPEYLGELTVPVNVQGLGMMKGPNSQHVGCREKDWTFVLRDVVDGRGQN